MPPTLLRSATLIGLGVLAVTTWLPFVPARADHAPPAADVVVDTFADSFDGTCDDDDCSLRDAVASAAPGETIGVPAGVITLARTGAGPDSGDLDLTADVAVVGTGATGTFIVPRGSATGRSRSRAPRCPWSASPFSMGRPEGAVGP